MKIVLVITLGWIALGILAGLFVGSFIRAGKGHEERETRRRRA